VTEMFDIFDYLIEWYSNMPSDSSISLWWSNDSKIGTYVKRCSL